MQSIIKTNISVIGVVLNSTVHLRCRAGRVLISEENMSMFSEPWCFQYFPISRFLRNRTSTLRGELASAMSSCIEPMAIHAPSKSSSPSIILSPLPTGVYVYSLVPEDEHALTVIAVAEAPINKRALGQSIYIRSPDSSIVSL